MFTKTKNGGQLAELEAKVIHAKAFLDAANASHREARVDLEIASSDLREAESLANIEAHRAALATSQRTAKAKGEATAALAEAEKQLVFFQEGPARAELAEALQARRKRIAALKTKLLSDLRALEGEILETLHLNLTGSIPGGGSHVRGTCYQHLAWLVDHLGATDGLESFLIHMDRYALGVLAGSQPADLGANFIAEQRKFARAG